MREAAADLDFEEAARLRDEVKRLRATELAVIDDPTAKHVRVEQTRGPRSRGRGRERPHKPALDEMGIALYHERQVHRPGGAQEARSAGSATGIQKRHNPRKPTLDEMGPGTESALYRPQEARSAEGPTGRQGKSHSTGGRPGSRGGWRRKGRN